MLNVATGWSDEPNTAEATSLALDMAEAKLDGQIAKAAMVFAAINFDLDDMVKTIRSKYKDIALIGCTTDGEITEGEGFLEDSVVITLFGSDTIEFSAGIGHGAISDPKAATQAAAEMALDASKDKPALCIALLDGLGTNIHHLLDGLKDSLGPDVPIVGGAAGDQLKFQGTKQIFNDDVVQDAAVILTLRGPITMSTGVATGYEPLSQPHKVTRADGASVFEIDGRPAADIYADYLQEPSIFYPLAVQSKHRKTFVLSSPLNFDQDTGALHLVNPIEQDSMVRLATASRDDIVSAASNAVGQALANFPVGEKVDAALLFSCAGRRATLGTRTGEEYETIQTLIGKDVPTAGFYCYGEIGPEAQNGPSLTHTNAFVAVLLGSS